MRSEKMLTEDLAIDELHCPDCAAKVEAAVNKISGVNKATVNLAAGRLRVTYAEDQLHRHELIRCVRPQTAG